MTTIRSSASGHATAATSVTVNAGSPQVGDLVLVWLATSNEIVVHSPNWNGTNQWFHAWQCRPGYYSGATLTLWYHTWNAADAASPQLTFAFVPAPSLGEGDKALNTADCTWVCAVVESNSIVEWAPGQAPDSFSSSVQLGPQKHAQGVTAFTAAMQPTPGATLSLSGGSLVQAPAGGPQSLAVWTQTGSAGLAPKPTSSSSTGLCGGFLTVSDQTPRYYNPPVIQEGPAAEDALFFRYMLTRYYTVLDVGGVYEAVRYTDTDQLALASAVFTNNAPVTSSQVSALLSSGVGGDFRYLNVP